MITRLLMDCRSRLKRGVSELAKVFPTLVYLSCLLRSNLQALMWRCADTKGGCTRQQLLCPCSCRSMFKPHVQQGSSRRGFCTPLRLRKQVKRQLQQCWSVRADSSEGVAQSDSTAQSSSKEKPKPAKAAEEMPQPVLQLTAIESHGLKPLHLVTFFIILGAGLVFLSVLLYFTADIQFQQACFKVRGSLPWSAQCAQGLMTALPAAPCCLGLAVGRCSYTAALGWLWEATPAVLPLAWLYVPETDVFQDGGPPMLSGWC